MSFLPPHHKGVCFGFLFFLSPTKSVLTSLLRNALSYVQCGHVVGANSLISARFKAAGSAQCLRLRVAVVFGFFEKHGCMCRVKKHRCPCLGTMQHSHHFLKGSSWTAIIYLPRRLKQQFLIFFSNISTSQESGKNNSMSGCYE